MVSFNIIVRSEKEDKRIPIAVASDIMFDIQLLLTHIGEYLIAEEFGSLGRPAGKLTERFTLFIDPNSGGISFRSSAGKGKSVLMDKAVALLKDTMDKIGSGQGMYWIGDAFKDPRYRCIVLQDLIELSKHMNPERGYSLLAGPAGKEKRFDPLDIDKAREFMNKNARSSHGSIAGTLQKVSNKRNVPMYSFTTEDDHVRITFRSKDPEDAASGLLNRPVLVKGTLRYSTDGELLEITDSTSVEPFDKKEFDHIITSERDIPLVRPLTADVRYDGSVWKLACPDLGITSSSPEWDIAVTGFHDYFVFLYENYSPKSDDELSEEEKEVKELLLLLTGKRGE